MAGLEGILRAANTNSPEGLIKAAERYSADLPPRPAVLQSRTSGAKDVVLITGTTGNFGCDLLEILLRDETVGMVYALNRKGSQAQERQKAVFREREFDGALLESPGFKMVEGVLDAPGFGLEPDLFAEIRSSVTCIIHNAWLANFNTPIHAFETYLNALRRLIDLSLSSPFFEPPKVLFVSSIAVFQSCDLMPPVPEEPMTAASALGTGYGEAKWIGEQMLFNISERTGLPVQTVRVGQMCGDRNGHWNEGEWLAIMVKSALLTRCLPDVDGVAAFIPNHPAARALIEMRSSPAVVMHLVHPRPTRLRALLASVADELSIPLVPYTAWLEALERSAQSIAVADTGNVQAEYAKAMQQNPALSLLGFFAGRKVMQSNDISPFIALSTDNAREASDTLEYLPELEEDVAIRWLSAWRSAGFLDS